MNAQTSSQEPCDARIFEGIGIAALRDARDYAGKHGIVGSIPLISLLRTNSVLENKIWDVTFATSTIIQALQDRKDGDVIVSHGVTYDFMRQVSGECEIQLTPEQTLTVREALSQIPIFSYADLFHMPLGNLPLQYQIRIKRFELKTPEELAIALFGHPRIYHELKEKHFKDKNCFDQGDLSMWLDDIFSLRGTSWAALLHFGDRQMGVYSDYIGFEGEENYVLGVTCSDEICLTDSVNYLKNARALDI